jgi:hypothetical protein
MGAPGRPDFSGALQFLQ